MVCQRASGEAGATAPKLNLRNLAALQQSNAAAISKPARGGLQIPPNYTNFLSDITDS